MSTSPWVTPSGDTWQARDQIDSAHIGGVAITPLVIHRTLAGVTAQNTLRAVARAALSRRPRAAYPAPRSRMAPIIPDRNKIHSFASQAAFEAWLRANHASETELWLKIHKKGSGKPTVSPSEAIDVALCWGWIDGQRKSFDDHSFLQRYTPRRAKSIWSQINREHVARLIAAGRMTPHGQRQIDAAKADGRWDAAYAAIRNTTVETMPADLRAAIDANPRARKSFAAIGRQDLFSLVFRTNNMKTPEGRAKKIAALVDKLARDGTIVGAATPKRTAAPKRTTATPRKARSREA